VIQTSGILIYLILDPTEVTLVGQGHSYIFSMPIRLEDLAFLPSWLHALHYYNYWLATWRSG